MLKGLALAEASRKCQDLIEESAEIHLLSSQGETASVVVQAQSTLSRCTEARKLESQLRCRQNWHMNKEILRSEGGETAVEISKRNSINYAASMEV